MNCCRLVAYEDRQGHFIFVKVPDEYGRYVRTSKIVALAECPSCGSAIGVPCIGQYGRYTGSIHADRMRLANATTNRWGLRRDDLLVGDRVDKGPLGFWSVP